MYFWHYNFGKRGVVLDLDDDRRAGSSFAGSPSHGRRRHRHPTARAISGIAGIGYERLAAEIPGLIYVRISPFGDDGPWAEYRRAIWSIWPWAG